MLCFEAVTILAAAAAAVGASPIIDTPDSPILVDRQGTGPVVPSPPTIPTFPALPPFPPPILAPYLNLRWPTIGRFNGTPGASCGDPLLADLAQAVAYEDCVDAATLFRPWLWYGTRGRQTETSGNCVAVWHPAVLDQPRWTVTGSTLRDLFYDLIEGCSTGSTFGWVTNFAYLSEDGVGTVSLYNLLSGEQDWMGDDRGAG